MHKYSILISTCDKFSDLWDEHLRQLKKHWRGELPFIYLVTDKKTNRVFEGVCVLNFEGDMPKRLKSALLMIPSEYVLLTLDDYFVIEDINVDKIKALVDYAKCGRVSYLSLFDRSKMKGYRYKRAYNILDIDLKEKYAVNLYPAIWNKEYLISCVDEDATPWEFEPLLTAMAESKGAICKYDQSGCFVILDVVRKGRVLRKANRYFKKNNIYIGDRPLTKRSFEMKLALMDAIVKHTPKWFSKLCKKMAKDMGMKFYSND